MPKFENLTGKRFGCMEVIGLDEERSKQKKTSYWLCKCECGNIKSLKNYSLKTNNYSDCHCNQRSYHLITHGKTNTRIYHIWCTMKARCYRKTSDHYVYYGGIGITVCDEWKNDFSAFYNWSMEHGYSDNLTIDRIDVSKGYSPNNCRWITLEEQAKNKRNTKRITIDGETKTVHEWSAICGVPSWLLGQRARQFTPLEDGSFTKDILKPSLLVKRVSQYTEDGKLIKTWNSKKEAVNAGFGTISGITHCCIGDTKQHNGYIWKYEE